MPLPSELLSRALKGDPLAAAELGRELDALHGQAWGQADRVYSWTPQLYQNGNVASTLYYARYWVRGSLVGLAVQLQATAAGSAGSAIEIRNVPVPIRFGGSAGGGAIIGAGVVLRTGTAWYAVSVDAYTASSLRFFGYNVSAHLGIGPSYALASSDLVSFSCVYERG